MTNAAENLCVFYSSKYTKNLIIQENNIYLNANFKSFTELNFSACNEIIDMAIWYIIPNEKLILNGNLDFMSPNNRRMRIKLNGEKLFIQLARLKGFEVRLSFSPFRYIEYVDLITSHNYNAINWLITDSNFDFYIGEQLIENKDCNQTLLRSENYFQTIHNLYLQKSVKFSTQVCPYLFTLAYFRQFIIHELSLSALTDNVIEFNNLTIEQDLNCVIIFVAIFVYKIDFNAKILSHSIFKIKNLNISQIF